MEGVPKIFPSVSIVVPTYKEAESLPLLLDRLAALRTATSLDFELLIMDDNSRDGTVELIAARNLPWVQLVVRTTDRGLSPSVVDGFKRATKDVVVVMDADLSHPPERIPDMLDALAKGSEFVIGSRYVPGASTDEAWGVFRWLNSKVATVMARPFTTLNDPMSGFFAFRREMLGRSDPLNAIGYKIGLEVLVKSKVTKASEIPIHFAQRQKGESKLSFKEQIRYIQHLERLFGYKFPFLAAAFRVLADAGAGLVATLVVMTALFAWDTIQLCGWLSWIIMALMFQPILRFYRLSPLWGIALPLMGAFYAAFTLDSAFQHWSGKGGMWKGRAQDQKNLAQKHLAKKNPESEEQDLGSEKA